MSYVPIPNPLPISGALTDAELRADPLSIVLADSVQLDAFGRLRVSEAVTLFDSQQEYGLDTLRSWDATANGTLSNASPSTNGSVTNGSNAVGPTNSDTRMTPITVSSTNNHYSILQSRQYVRYIPGKSHLVLLTGIFSSGTPGSVAIVRRTSTSGSAVDTEIAQASWNIDKLDGTGVSGLTIDFTKTQILFIQAQWLGVGRVVVGFDINGILYPAHQFLNANSLTVPYTQTFNLPIRLEGRSNGTNATFRSGYFDLANGIFLKTVASTAGGTINFVCCSAQSEGGVAARGYPRSIGNDVTTISVTTRRPILSIRPKATFNSRTNRAHIAEIEAAITAGSGTAYYEVIYGGTLTGASFASVATSSITEYDVAATAITGGVVVVSGYVSGGSVSARGEALATSDGRNPFTLSQIDALTTYQDNVTIVCTSFTGSVVMAAALNWHEKTT